MILNRDRNATTAVSRPAMAYAIGAAVALLIVCSLLSPVIAVPAGQQKPASPKKQKSAPPAPAPVPARPEAPPVPAEAPEPPDILEAPLPAIAAEGFYWEDELLLPEPPAAFAPAAPLAPAAPPAAFGPAVPPAAFAPALPDVSFGLAQGVGISRGGGVALAPGVNLLGQAQEEKKTPAIPEAELLNVLVEIVKKDADPTVRQEALQGIYRMRSDAAVNALIGLYDSQSDVKVKGEIIAFLIRRNADNSKAIAKLTTIAKNEQNAELRDRAIRYLSRVPGDEGANTLIQIYDSLQDPKMKMSVVRSLGSNRSRKAIDKLIQIAKNDSDPAVRQAAVRSLNSDGRTFQGLTALPPGSIGQFGPMSYDFDNGKWEQMQNEWREKNRELIDRLQKLDDFKFDGKQLDEMLRKLQIELPKIELQMKELKDGGQRQFAELEAQLRAHRIQLRTQLEGMRSQYTEQHPKRIETQRMLESVEKELEELRQLGRSTPRPVRISTRVAAPVR